MLLHTLSRNRWIWLKMHRNSLGQSNSKLDEETFFSVVFTRLESTLILLRYLRLYLVSIEIAMERNWQVRRQVFFT